MLPAHRNANYVPSVEEGSERTLVLTFHTECSPFPASLNVGSSLLSLSWAEETVGFPVGKEKFQNDPGESLRPPVVNTPGVSA